MTDEEIKALKKENEKLKKKVKKLKTDIKNRDDDSRWEFHWDGRGSYEEARRCFYGDFS